MSDVPAPIRRHSNLISMASEMVPDELLAALIRIGVTRSWTQDQVLHWSGDRLSSVFCALQGRLKIRRFDSDGNEQILSWFEKGTLVAVAPVIIDKPFQFDIVADGPCRVLHVSRLPFMQLLEHDASVASAIAVLLSERLSFIMESHVTQANNTLAERVWFRLSRMAAQVKDTPSGGSPFIAITQQELADAVGGSRYRVGLELQRLADRGLIALARGRIQLLRTATAGDERLPFAAPIW